MSRLQARLGVVALSLLYLVVLSGRALQRHAALDSNIFDLGIHDQATWLAASGLDPFLSARGQPVQADHFSLIVFWLAPLYWFVSGPQSLLVAQTALFAGAAPAVYALARLRHCGRGESLAWVVLYLLQPALLCMTLFDFHFNALVVPFLLYALVAIHRNRPVAYFACLAAALSCSEIGPICALFMIPEAWGARGRALGLGTLAAALAGFLATAVSLRLHGQAQTAYLALYCQFGPDAAHVLASLLHEPARWWRAFWEGLEYLGLLTGCTGGLCLLGLERLLPALPVLAGNLLTWRVSQRTLNFQYNAAVLPFLLWAAIVGYSRLRLRYPRPARLALALAALTCLSLWPWDPVAGSYPEPDRRARLADQLDVGADEVLSVDNRLGAGYCHRPNVYMFPNPFWPSAWGPGRQALIDQTGRAFFAPEPGAARRALDSVKIDRALLQFDGYECWPLMVPDRKYLVQQFLAHPRYRVEVRGRVLVIQPGPRGGPVHLPPFDQGPWVSHER